MQLTYAKNYVKIYFWQGVSMALNFLSMFIVIPFLTLDPTIYGIYSLCISFSIFLSYADFGFLGSGQKYAAECFSRGDDVTEIKIVGFTMFVLAIFLAVLASGFIFLSLNPKLLVKGIANENQQFVASSLFLILAIFTPTSLLQRLLQMIYGVRMEDFIVQRTYIVGNIFKIGFVYFFFNSQTYNIVGYFLFTQAVNLLAVLISLFIAKYRYAYDFISLKNSFRFDREVFNKTKGLAYASLVLTISWILYYELDSIAIGKLIGVKWVAIYAVGSTILSFFRSLFGVLYSPFNIRFNHLIGERKDDVLKDFVQKIIVIFVPIVIIPIIAIVLFSKAIVLTWVGRDYLLSTEIIQYLVLCNLFAFISYPISILLMAKEEQKQMYIIALIVPLIFWFGVLNSIKLLGVTSFAIFKLVSFLISFILYYRIMLNYLRLKFIDSIMLIFKPVLFSTTFLISASFFLLNYLPNEKSKFNLLIIALVISLLIFVSFIIQYFTSENWKSQVKRAINTFK